MATVTFSPDVSEEKKEKTKEKEGKDSEEEEERELWCAICLSVLKSPRQLPCLHAYCLQCFHKLAPSTKLTIVCPTCRRETILPPEGVSGLPVDTALLEQIERIREKKRERKREREKQVCQNCSTTSHCISCSHCSEVYCTQCAMSHCSELSDSVEQITAQLESIKRELQIDAKLDNSGVRESEGVKRTRSSRSQSRSRRAVAEAAILDKIKTDYDESRRNTKRILFTLTKALSSSKEIVCQKYESNSRLYPESNTILNQLNSLTHQYIFLNKLKDSLDSRLINNSPGTDDRVHDFLCHSDKENQETAVNDRKSLGSLPRRRRSLSRSIRRNRSRERLTKLPPKASPTPQVANNDSPNENVLVDLTETMDVNACLPPTSKGRILERQNSDSTAITNQDLENQSLYYRCKPSRSYQKLLSKSSIRRPTDVAWCHWNNSIYVTTSQTAKVLILKASPSRQQTKPSTRNSSKKSTTKDSKKGTQSTTFGVRSNTPGGLLCPQAIVCSPLYEELYVLDKWRNVILVFTLDGQFLREFGRNGRSNENLSAPEGLDVDAEGRLYVSDTCHDRVLILDRFGTQIKELGTNQLTQPAGVSISADGKKVLVADTGNHRCRVYCCRTGRLLYTFGGRGSNQGQMESPECVSFDSLGFMLVGDSGNHRIQIFRPNGHFVRYLGSRNGASGELEMVTGITVTPSHEVLVTDFGKHSLLVY